MAKRRQDVLPFDGVEHAGAQHASVLDVIDEEIDRIIAPALAASLNAILGYLVGPIASIDAMELTLRPASDVVTAPRWIEIALDSVNVSADVILRVVACEQHFTHVFVSQADADVFLHLKAVKVIKIVFAHLPTFLSYAGMARSLIVDVTAPQLVWPNPPDLFASPGTPRR
jgi:hypothetical protein